MVCKAMGFRCNTCGIRLSCFAILILVLGIQGCWSLIYEGSVLLEFRAGVDLDPHGVFANWNPIDNDPCGWSGVHCVDGEVQMLDLNGLSLGGELVPELGKLSHLRFLVLRNNQFYGGIPKDIGGLTMLEVLDLRNNNLSGTIPAELGGLQSLKRLLLCNNNFNGDFPSEFGRLNLLSELQFDENLTFAVTTGTGCINRKFGNCIWRSCLKQPKKADAFTVKGTLLSYLNALPLFKSEKDSSHSPEYNCCDNLQSTNEEHLVHNVQNLVNIGRRRLLQQSSNLAALPAIGAPPEKITSLPITRSSGSFPAIPKGQLLQPASPWTQQSPSNPHNKPTDQKPSSNGASGHTWKYIVGGSVGVVLLLVAVTMFSMCRSRAVSTIGPWKTGLSGQLQKAFVTGVPKLNRAELETACEDFSNIIETIDGCTIYKGTLSSGVEIAVASTAIFSVKDWSKRSEVTYRKKIGTLSRVNHKNFVNLIGYCEEEEPFTRMMVFEYAPNGTLFEHLHVKEVEHLDWNARTRIIMGTAYCLQYMHDLNPPVAHSNLNSNAIFLTDDYAAKIAEICFRTEATSKSRISGENESEHSELPPFSDPETNVSCFGLLLIEIISGKLSYSEEQGPLVNWATQYLNDKRSISYLIDPTLKNFKNNELDIICEVIQDCIQPDARKRPTMKEITSRLREVIAITPDAATPRLSPLWWAELEILSVEAA
ncbi:Protein MALE DISCOVERER 2 like [Actinidia chinensis var. chinensis]|uniref:Protein MALE DISCOVERER 2 like n=1 Tax=Actinidia chinensis var. chinensis TaxID=1590841 RepID=A0A2R6RG96_ACTCC|nr:Protein MALE DISCOVERER 2 like [Actinidia chinensis var. chinensis]